MSQEQESEGSRPSFSSFWRRTKDEFTAKRLKFMPSNLSASGSNKSNSPHQDDKSSAEDEKAAMEKAKTRRAQVRKAQIQHRQRKANYVKQLEIDIAALRNQIADAEGEAQTLARENEVLRRNLSDAAGPSSPPRHDHGGSVGQALSSSEAPTMTMPDTDVGMQGFSFDDIFAQAEDPLFVNFLMDVNMGQPAYQVWDPGNASPEVSDSTQTMSTSASDAGTNLDLIDDPLDMTSKESQQAINFILALEHICWNHANPDQFTGLDDPEGDESGHMLMATNVVLRSAPQTFFDKFSQTAAQVAGVPQDSIAVRHAQVDVPPVGSTTVNWPQKLAEPVQASPASQSSSVSEPWKSPDLTLKHLYGLACSLNPSDVELTPVQAWFEMADKYPATLLQQQAVLDELKRQLLGVVTCPVYGAVMNREAFESVLGRVLDPIVTQMWVAHSVR